MEPNHLDLKTTTSPTSRRQTTTIQVNDRDYHEEDHEQHFKDFNDQNQQQNDHDNQRMMKDANELKNKDNKPESLFTPVIKDIPFRDRKEAIRRKVKLKQPDKLILILLHNTLMI